MRSVALVGTLLLATASAPHSRADAAFTVPEAQWLRSAEGLERAVVDVATESGWRTRIVVVRIDPTRFRFRLRARLTATHPGWTIERAPRTAVLAFNAGQFAGVAPWGWVVMDGREIRPPGRGPLSTAVAWDRAGRVRWLDPHEIEQHRGRGEIVEAIQSYPTLLDAHGSIPRPIRTANSGVDVTHRDARLAIGRLRNGQVLVAITRFYGLGPLSPPVPLGLTLEEMAIAMRDLGCVRAVSLDGGVSSQLMLREFGRTLAWRGWRPVPLGLVAEPLTRPSILDLQSR